MQSRRVFFKRIISEGGISPVNVPLDSAAAGARREFALRALSFSPYLLLFHPSLIPLTYSSLFCCHIFYLPPIFLYLFYLFRCCRLVEKENVLNERKKWDERSRGKHRERERERTAASLAFLEKFHTRTCRMTIESVSYQRFIG